MIFRVMQSPPEFRRFAENKISTKTKETPMSHVYKPVSQEKETEGIKENINRGNRAVNGR